MAVSHFVFVLPTLLPSEDSTSDFFPTTGHSADIFMFVILRGWLVIANEACAWGWLGQRGMPRGGRIV
jgi:hypothetical protein